MDIKRRRMLTEPGDTLLLSKSSMDTAFRFTEWQETTGLTPNRFTADPICSVPLPIYTQVAPGTRQFSSVRPELMWHPLFWLPPRLAGRYNLPSGPGGALEVESTTMWSIRVALELTASGLYSIEDGWIDILATVGIDVENDVDLARIEEWQAGGVDDLLDSIDLDLYLKLETNPNWALQSAMALVEPATHAQWAILADSLMEMVSDSYDPELDTPLHEVRETIAVAASLAGVQLEEVPTDDEEPAGEFWARIELEARDGNYSTVQQFLAGPATEALGWLTLTRDTYWESVEDLQSLQGTPAA
ncbi:hypothetical protein Achl_4436 (plasmid) [Pseudarthrobacter chlorophenolicus A6]|uniref:Uncharacterized protein n=1 Tax=Pseudarthrobacter chlorophenolicus (strain ATCC 700700 / DSM 12829 / CIP 107037 / JCM 12360 / KCTC 9906 / NCIMB 13794 / A6) TaxID=452863 RepID=B8HIZ0_PSECP|nr:hypothetical protein [Pseudarthrobacter chlorophenolicus]ACL42387.1 hypothetical protein Achl_4436 [Pseudarthrobacter chlorophenolicus A6]SDQ17430.1 hypothetical protein SAMN04489738_0493 [Pseudarthrobacter chlorophenolicus]